MFICSYIDLSFTSIFIVPNAQAATCTAVLEACTEKLMLILQAAHASRPSSSENSKSNEGISAVRQQQHRAFPRAAQTSDLSASAEDGGDHDPTSSDSSKAKAL
jgi:hypothetical protein